MPAKPAKRKASAPKVAGGGAARSIRKRKAEGGGAAREREEDRGEDCEELEFTDEEADDAEFGEVHDCAQDDDEGEYEEEEEQQPQRAPVFRPGIDVVPDGEELEHDPKSYDMFHKLHTPWPALSFDIVRDGHGASRNKYPLSCYWVSGSQAPEREANYVALMKAGKMHRTRFDDGDEDEDEAEEDVMDEDDEDDEDDDEDDGEDAVLEQKQRPHVGAVNRVRVMRQRPTIVATWGEEGHVSVWDFSDAFRQLDDTRAWLRDNAASGGALAGSQPPLLFRSQPDPEGHAVEGYALDWSPLQEACLASGDMDGVLCTWQLAPDGTVARTPLTTVKRAPGPVEDIRWSPVQAPIFIAGCAAGSCQVYDARDPSGAKITWDAGCGSGQDINVLDWNPHRDATHLVATGGDDGCIGIWDLRKIQRGMGTNARVQSYNFHRGPITSLEWSPSNESMMAVASDDGQVTLWDFSIERDKEEEAALRVSHPELADYPAQLVFQHCALVEPKEVHWHPQIPGVVLVTDANGMDIFRPANWRSLMR
eukprot:Hpha_TRINITY_DN16421_c2_g5::TRINITY_DN16421_c2_g5_i1::g.158994::m.158994/K14848/RRB1, GRWD1; ribosome assembly protein RRB1